MDIFRFYGIFPSDKLLKIAGGRQVPGEVSGAWRAGGYFRIGTCTQASYTVRVTRPG